MRKYLVDAGDEEAYMDLFQVGTVTAKSLMEVYEKTEDKIFELKCDAHKVLSRIMGIRKFKEEIDVYTTRL